MEGDSQGLRVWAERSDFKLPGSNPDEFPTMIEFEEQHYHKIVGPAAQRTDPPHPVRDGYREQSLRVGRRAAGIGAERIVAVGTDGRRLAKMEGPAESVGGASTR